MRARGVSVNPRGNDRTRWAVCFDLDLIKRKSNQLRVGGWGERNESASKYSDSMKDTGVHNVYYVRSLHLIGINASIAEELEIVFDVSSSSDSQYPPIVIILLG